MTTKTKETPAKQMIIHEYEEDEEGNNTNHSEEWWKADFNYLPIHFFKKMMEENCYVLSSNDLNLRIIYDILNDVVEKITPTMIQEYHKEYKYFFESHLPTDPFPTLGYIDIMKEYLGKLIRVYLTPRFYGNEQIKNHIKDTFKRFFSKERYWNDDEIDHLEKIINWQDGGESLFG